MTGKRGKRVGLIIGGILMLALLGSWASILGSSRATPTFLKNPVYLGTVKPAFSPNITVDVWMTDASDAQRNSLHTRHPDEVLASVFVTPENLSYMRADFNFPLGPEHERKSLFLTKRKDWRYWWDQMRSRFQR